MNDTVTIRPSTEQDAASILKLAALDSRHPPEGQVLLAFVEDELQAALPLNGEPAIADPFRPTAELVELLSLWARGGNPDRSRRVRALAILRPRVA